MPTFLGVITACLCGYLVNLILKGYSPVLSGIVAFVVSVLVFYFMKKFISSIRP